jgi:hypothetical protein
MPQNTDLVTDLPADFEVFGQAVATSMADLLGGTTGQVLSKTSNTDMDFTWVTSDDANAIQNTIVDAKGDLIGATAADTPARLAVGTNGQVLTADSTAATGLAWATASSGLSAASQAEMETATSTTVAVTPGRQQYHPSSSKAWIVFNGEGTIAILGSYNVSSITDGGTGVYKVDWNVDFSSTNYAVVIGSAKTTDAAIQSSTVMVGGTYGIQMGYIEMFTANVDGTAKDSPRVNVVAYGDQ